MCGGREKDLPKVKFPAEEDPDGPVKELAARS